MSSAIVGTSTRPYSGFDPRSIQGCSLWLDAADSSTITLSGSNVTQWRDKSGNGQIMSSSGTIQYNKSQRRIELDGGANSFFTGPISSSAVSNPSYTIVSRQLSGDGPLFTLQTNAYGYFPRYSNGNLYLQSDTANWAVITSPVTNGVDFIHSIVYDSTSVNLWLSGTNSVNSSRTAFTTTNLDIGGRRANGASERMSGYIYEFIVFNTTLTTSQRQQLEGYLAWKWGLRSNLPATHPFRNAPPYTRSLLPIDITPSLWLDAADVSTMTLSGSNVTQWNDKSGNGRNASNLQTGALLTTNVQNGLSVLRFNGSTNNYSVSYSSFPRTAYTIFTVQFLSDSSSTYRRVIHGGASTNDQFLFVGVVGQNVATFTGSGSAWNDLNANTPNSNNLNLWRIVTTWVSGSTLTPYVDGTAQNNKTGTTAAFNNLTIGLSSASGNQRWFGDVGEIIIFDSALSTGQRQQIEGYLAWKWGLVSNLPSTHSFKRIQPLQVAFNPVQISGCQVWLDAADQSKITLSGTNVTSVVEKAQNLTFTTQGNSSFLTVVNAINNTPTLYFNNSSGENVYLQTGLANFLTGSFFVVWQAQAQSSINYRPFFAWQSTDGLLLPVFGYINSATTIAPYTSYTAAGTPTNVVTVGTTYITFYSWTGTTTNVGMNAAIPTSGTQPAYSSSSSTFHIMGEIAGQLLTTTGYIGEMIFYNRVVNAIERQRIEGYLAHKWGFISRIRSTHPYVRIRP